MVKNSEHSFKKSDDEATSTASDKFKGELAKVYDTESSDSDEYNYLSKTGKRHKSVGRPKVRMSNYFREQPPPAFVMKLFDRSVDLTKFLPDTPLYPICRAWFRNNPKDTSKKDLFKRKEDKIVSPKDVLRFPPPIGTPIDVPPICKPPTFHEFSIGNDSVTPSQSKEELLETHVEHWKKIRNRYRKASSLKESRYAPSIRILRDMYAESQLSKV